MKVAHSLGVVLAICLSVFAGCGGDSGSPTTPTPATPPAILEISTFGATGAAIAGGFSYTITIQVRETGGRSAATVTGGSFALQNDQGAAAGSISFTAAEIGLQTVSAGTASETKTFTTSDTRPGTAFASTMSARVNYADGAVVG